VTERHCSARVIHARQAESQVPRAQSRLVTSGSIIRLLPASKADTARRNRTASGLDRSGPC
jgi:hypothetical protein